MKLFRSVTLDPKNCPQDLYERVVRLNPRAQMGSIFHLEAKPGDEANAQLVERIVALCRERGLDKARGEYSYRLAPAYEMCDFEAAPLLLLLTQKRMFKGINSNRRDDRGYIVLPATGAKATIKIASIFPEPWIVVSDRTRRILESGQLMGLKFDKVAIKGHSLHVSPEPFWELRSTIGLPKMVNSVINETSERGRAPYTIQDIYVEAHYRRSDLEALGAFDLAFTFERMYNGSTRLVVSQRFHQHCRKNKIPLEVQPARIDPG